MGWRLFERIHRLADSFTGLLGTRLELFGLELQEEIERFLGHLALLLAAGVLGGFALLGLTLAVLVVAARADCLLAASLLVALAYGLLALASGLWLRRRVRNAPPIFAATRSEFERDRQTLHQPPSEARE